MKAVPLMISDFVSTVGIILIHVANQLRIKEPSHTSLSCLPSLITSPSGVTCKWGMNLANQFGREIS